MYALPQHLQRVTFRHIPGDGGQPLSGVVVAKDIQAREGSASALAWVATADGEVRTAFVVDLDAVPAQPAA